MIIHSVLSHRKWRHSCESRNPENHWIPGQARNDKSCKTYVVAYRKPFLLVGVITLLIVIVGCASSRLDRDRGNSFHQAIANQTLHPESAKNLEPVTGFDGRAAQSVIERYEKDFEKPEPTVPYTLTIGTIGKK